MSLMSDVFLMDRNHLLMPVDRLSVATAAAEAAGMAHSWNQERSASQPLSPMPNSLSPFPPSPIMPPSTMIPSPPSTPFYLLPNSPLPSPTGGSLPATEFQLLQVPASRFTILPLGQRRDKQQQHRQHQHDDDDDRSVYSASTTSTSDATATTASLSPTSSLSTPNSAILSGSDMSAPVRFRSSPTKRAFASAPTVITPNAADPFSCYSTLSGSPFGVRSADDTPSPNPDPPRRRSLRPIIWPALSPINLPPVSALASLSFDCTDFSEDQLLVYTLHTFVDLNLVTSCSLSLPHLQTFLLSIRAHYRVNPYHNWYHGFHVFQFGYYMLTRTRLQELLTPIDQLALLLSCLCHDVDHPGTTNDFQIAIDSGLARVHNEIAVLENHHAFITCEILRHPMCNFFTAITAQQFRSFRKIVVAAILATDMAVHFELCRQFRRLDTDLAEYKREKEEDRQMVINLVVHSSDLSAQVMDFPIASQWEARVTAEFIAQNEVEQSLGVAVTPHMTGLRDYQNRFEKHLGFLQFVMQPLWDVVSDVLPPMQQCVDSLNSNKQRYRQRMQQAASERDEEREPINSATSSSSAPSSVASSSNASAAVSVTVTPSATTAPTPDVLSPRDASSSSPSFAYQALEEEQEADDQAGKVER